MIGQADEHARNCAAWSAELSQLRADLAKRDADCAAMRQTLQGIANANWREWDAEMADPNQFVAWAKSRANHSLRSTAGTELLAEVERLRAEVAELRAKNT